METKTYSSGRALVRGATYALIGVSLAACGGSGGGGTTATPNASASALDITDSNAAAVTNELMTTEQFLPALPSLLFSIATHTSSCPAGGSVSTTGSSSAPPQTFTFSQCKPFNSSLHTALYNGSLVFDFPSSAPYPITLTVSNLAFSDKTYSSSGAPQTDNRLQINADLTASSGYNVGMDGSFYLIRTNATNSSRDITLDWRFKNYQLNVDSSRKGPDNVSGRQTLNDLGGYVDIGTDQGLTYGTSSTCPITGQITVNGAGSSYLQLTFNGGDSVTVTVNGNAASYTCSEFTSWVGPIMNPLT